MIVLRAIKMHATTTDELTVPSAQHRNRENELATRAAPAGSNMRLHALMKHARTLA